MARWSAVVGVVVIGGALLGGCGKEGEVVEDVSGAVPAVGATREPGRDGAPGQPGEGAGVGGSAEEVTASPGAGAAHLAHARERYKKLKLLENQKPQARIVCKFSDGRFAGSIQSHVSGDQTRAVATEEQREARRRACQRHFNATWEVEDPVR